MDEAFGGLQQSKSVHEFENFLVAREHDGGCALPFQTCMRNKREEKGLCILEANETKHSSEKAELLLNCDDYCITYYNQAFT